MSVLKSFAVAASLAFAAPAAAAAISLAMDNHQGSDASRLSAAPDAARKVTSHRSAESAAGGMTMTETALPIPVPAVLTLQPGLNHIMLTGLTRTSSRGDMVTLTLTLTLTFAGAVTIDLPVTSP